MQWLKDRLRTVNKTPGGLARALGVAAPRIYEMIAGKRRMQSNEIEPTAIFLEWTTNELLDHLPKYARPTPAPESPAEPGKAETDPRINAVLTTTRTTSMIPVLSATIPFAEDFDCLLTGETSRFIETLPALKGRGDIQCLYIASTVMQPWRDSGDLVVFEKEKPPKPGTDHVVIYLINNKTKPPQTRVLIRRLLQSKSPRRLRLLQYNPPQETTLEIKEIASMYRVVTWEDCFK